MVGRGAHPGGGLDRQQNDHGKGATTRCFERFVKEEGRRDSFLYSKSIPPGDQCAWCRASRNTNSVTLTA